MNLLLFVFPFLFNYVQAQLLCTEIIDVAVPPNTPPITSQHPEYPVPANFTFEPMVTDNKPPFDTAYIGSVADVQLLTKNFLGLGVLLGVIVGVFVGVGVGVLVKVGVLVGVDVGVLVGVLVIVTDGVTVTVGVGVCVGVLVCVGVFDGDKFGVLVGVAVLVTVGVTVGVTLVVGVIVGVTVLVGVTVFVGVTVGVTVLVGVGVGIKLFSQLAQLAYDAIIVLSVNVGLWSYTTSK